MPPDARPTNIPNAPPKPVLREAASLESWLVWKTAKSPQQELRVYVGFSPDCLITGEEAKVRFRLSVKGARLRVKGHVGDNYDYDANSVLRPLNTFKRKRTQTEERRHETELAAQAKAEARAGLWTGLQAKLSAMGQFRWKRKAQIKEKVETTFTTTCEIKAQYATGDDGEIHYVLEPEREGAKVLSGVAADLSGSPIMTVWEKNPKLLDHDVSTIECELTCTRSQLKIEAIETQDAEGRWHELATTENKLLAVEAYIRTQLALQDGREHGTKVDPMDRYVPIRLGFSAARRAPQREGGK